MGQARSLHKLSARAVAARTKSGRLGDGGGLWLVVSKSGAKRWAFLFMQQGKQHEHGLGSCLTTTLAQAREKAAECRQDLAAGLNPIVVCKVPLVPPQQTFQQCAGALIKSKRPQWRSAKHAGQWPTTIEQYCAPILQRPVAELTTADVLSWRNHISRPCPINPSRCSCKSCEQIRPSRRKPCNFLF